MNRRAFLQSSLSIAALQALPGVAMGRSSVSSAGLPLASEASATQSRSKLVVAGIGGAGINFVRELATERMQRLADFHVYDDEITADGDEVSNTPIQYKCLGLQTINDHPSCGVPCPHNKIVENPFQMKEDIKHHLVGVQRLIVVAGMGGRTGTAVLPIFMEAARESGINTTVVVTHPFAFEPCLENQGAFALRSQQFNAAYHAIRRLANARFMIPNAATQFRGGTLGGAIRSSNRQLGLAVRALIELHTSPGGIPSDLVAIDNILAEEGYGLAGSGIASGEMRIKEAMERALSSPFLGGDLYKRSAKGAVVAIHSNGDLTRQEISEAENKLRHALRRKTSLAIGTVHDDLLAPDQVRVTLLLSGLALNSHLSSKKNEAQH